MVGRAKGVQVLAVFWILCPRSIGGDTAGAPTVRRGCGLILRRLGLLQALDDRVVDYLLVLSFVVEVVFLAKGKSKVRLLGAL